MTRAKGIKNEIAGKAKQLVGEVVGDQRLHDEGRLQERQGERQNRGKRQNAGKRQHDKPSAVNPLRRLDRLA